MKRFYITTAIDYVNNLPHLGTAYEKIGADAIARFRRMEGEAVHFQMGNDEHSANVKKEALKRGLSPQKYCNVMRKEFVKIWRALEISFDDFIQTSEKRHQTAVVQLFEAILKKGDIYKAPYEGWYCESCEAFYTEKDLIDGKCPNHKREPRWLKEENYFFRLSAYQSRLLDHYRKHPEFILPAIRRNEVARVVEGGLQDISISRASFDWGIPLPIDKGHVVYVWFDALINYISAIGYGQGPAAKSRFKKWWPVDLHVIGKDITRFHCVIWPAMLMSAGLPLPKTIFGHGFVTLKGEKMSKTLGNIVTPLDVVPRYGADSLRYFLLSQVSFGSDSDFTWGNFITRYNSDLANDIGNLLNRTLGMMNRYLKGRIRKVGAHRDAPLLKETISLSLKTVRDAMDFRKNKDVAFHKAMLAIWDLVHATDKFIDRSAPWTLSKEGKEREIAQVLYTAVDTLRNIALLISPFLPETSREIWRQLGLTKKLKWERQTFKNIGWGKTPAVKVTKGKPIFPRIEETGPVSGSAQPCSEKSARPGARPSPPVSSHTTQKETAMIDISEFQKLDLRVAEVIEAQRIEGTDKLLRLQVDIGGELRQIVAGIAQHYSPEELMGKKVVVVANLKPATIRGVESNGMLLAASNNEDLSILTVDRPIGAGSKIK